jgi:hypothetical protein
MAAAKQSAIPSADMSIRAQRLAASTSACVKGGMHGPNRD